MSEASTSVSDEQPITRFARFFKAYGIGLSLVIAALPVGAAYWDLIPLFQGTKGPLTLITSVGSYLLVGFIFAQRHILANSFFPGRKSKTGKRVAYGRDLKKSKILGWTPAALAILGLALLFLYLNTVESAERAVAYKYAEFLPDTGEKIKKLGEGDELRVIAKLPAFAKPANEKEAGKVQITFAKYKSDDRLMESHSVLFFDEDSIQGILKGTPSAEVPYWVLMGGLFLGAFLCIVSAFVLMGLKDYLQEVLGVTDQTLISEPTIETLNLPFQVKDAPGLYAFAEFSPDAPELEPVITGPFCYIHKLEPRPIETDSSTGKVTTWGHVFRQDNKPDKTELCNLAFKLTEVELSTLFETEGRRKVQEETKKRATSESAPPSKTSP